MASAHGLTDPAARLVADASAIINLIATGAAFEIISALPNPMAVVSVVPEELETGRIRGREAFDGLNDLVAKGVLSIVELDEAATPYFEELVVGPAALTLDDGEAATIAYALAHAGTALIDERKATRICTERFPELSVVCSVDVLIHAAVQSHLGPDVLAEAVFNALHRGRMGVPSHHLALVTGLIGEERAAQCPSLPRRVRTLP